MKRERHNTYTNYAATANRKGLFDNFTAKAVIQADDMAHAERLAAQWAKVFNLVFDSLVVEQTDGESS